MLWIKSLKPRPSLPIILSPWNCRYPISPTSQCWKKDSILPPLPPSMCTFQLYPCHCHCHPTLPIVPQVTSFFKNFLKSLIPSLSIDLLLVCIDQLLFSPMPNQLILKLGCQLCLQLCLPLCQGTLHCFPQLCQ